jgi:hypothetical protein
MNEVRSGTCQAVISGEEAVGPMTPIFKWSGEYFGFVYNENLFRADGAYLGWIEDGQVWASDGAYLGEVVEENYILRRTNMIPPLPKIARLLPIRPIRPIQEISRFGRISKAGWVDALEGFKQT